MELADLNISEKQKDVLAHSIKGITIGKAAAVMDVDYTRAWQVLNVWCEKGWVYKKKTLAGKALYFMNKELFNKT